MAESEEKGYRNVNRNLIAKLSVRNCQYEIALEGLSTIKESNDPMGIAEQTLNAMKDCIPD